MSYNGSGTFQINTSGQPVVTGTSISSTVFNALTADLATGLSTAITKDGQTTTTARIPFALGINSTLVTDATNTTSGSIITAGGVGIAKALFVGTTANVAGAVTLGGVATFSAQPIFSSLTASSAVATDASKGLVSVTNTGTGNNVLATGPTISGPTISDGTANGVAYLNGSKVLTTSATLTWNNSTQQLGFQNAAANGYAYIGNAGAGTNTDLAFYMGATESMRLTSTGLGIGTTSPTTPLQIQSTAATGVNSIFCTGSTTSFNFWTISNTSGNARIGVDSSSGGALATGSSAYSTVIGSSTATSLHLISNGAVGATIDTSGNFLVGTTTAGAKFTLEYDGGVVVGQNINDSANTTNSTLVQFLIQGTQVGTIKRVGATSAVIYNTTSDYRLKTVVGAVTGQGDRIDALKPINYLWKEGGTSARGFLAHEFQEVYANSVSGDKDAVDANGNPVYQAMQASTSEVIADLVAEIQSLRKRLSALELA